MGAAFLFGPNQRSAARSRALRLTGGWSACSSVSSEGHTSWASLVGYLVIALAALNEAKLGAFAAALNGTI